MSTLINSEAHAVISGWHTDYQHSSISISTDLVGLNRINFLLDLRSAALKLLNETMEDARRSYQSAAETHHEGMVMPNSTAA